MNQKKRILFIDEPHPVLAERLLAAGFHCDFQYKTPEEKLKALLPTYQGIIIRSRVQVTSSFLETAEQLEFIGRLGVGVEHIDLDYCADRGITVFTSPEGSRDTVAEHALGMLLMLMNHLGRADREVRAGQWRREPNRGVEIKGKTVGILGYGNMGSAFAQRLAGFDARVIAYDKFKKNYGDAHAEAVSLETLFTESDILSVHIPYLPENHHFINDTFFKRFAKPIFLVNTARGTVLDTAALVTAIESGQVRGAALDVIEYEEMSFSFLEPDSLPAPFQYLRHSDKTVLAPHIAGWSFESKKGHADTLADKIIKQFG